MRSRPSPTLSPGFGIGLRRLWAKVRTVRFAESRLRSLSAGNGPRTSADRSSDAAARTYEQLLQIWKNADADFIPAQEARRELAALRKH